MKFVGVVFKVNCDRKVTMLSHPNSSKFRFRNLPRSPAIQRLYHRHPFLTQRPICQTNQESVNMYSNDPFSTHRHQNNDTIDIDQSTWVCKQAEKVSV